MRSIDLSCTYLTHHELDSVPIIPISIIIIIMIMIMIMIILMFIIIIVRSITDSERWKSAPPAPSVHNVGNDSNPRPQTLPPNLLRGMRLV